MYYIKFQLFRQSIFDNFVGCTAADGVDAYLNGAQLAARLHSTLRCRSVRFAITTGIVKF